MSEFEIKDENPEYKFFTILPNLFSRLELTAFERSLYWALKECTGEKGSCTKSYANLAIASGMSEASVKRTLKTLAEPNKIIKKPLILITNRFNENGDKMTNEVVLVDVWSDNLRVCKEKNSKVTQTSPPVTQNPGQVTQTPGVRSHRPEGGVTQTYKEEPFINNPYKNTTTTKASAIKPSSAKVVPLSGGGGAAREKLSRLISECQKKKFPFEDLLIKELYEKYPHALLAVFEKYNKRKESERVMGNPGGWLRKQVVEQHELLEIKKDYI